VPIEREIARRGINTLRQVGKETDRPLSEMHRPALAPDRVVVPFHCFGRANSMPNLGAAAIIFSISLYGTSAGGGSVMDGAGTLNSLNHPSIPAGVRRASIRICSDSITKECTVWRGTITIVPGVALIVRWPTEKVISPSNT